MMLKIFHVTLLSALYFHQYALPGVEAWMGPDVTQVLWDEFPFSVALIDLTFSVYPAAQYFCGGSLITGTHVLTCAHCMDDKILTDLRVLIGSRNLESSRMRHHSINHFWTYEGWARSRNLRNSNRDIAVLTLKERTYFTPINLSPIKAEFLERIEIGMASWGLSVNSIVPNVMEKAYANILPRKECLDRTIRLSPLTRDKIKRRTFMCSAASPKVLGTCGNSGSPIFNRRTLELVGIHEGACTKITKDDPEEVNLLITIDSCRAFIRDAIQE